MARSKFSPAGIAADNGLTHLYQLGLAMSSSLEVAMLAQRPVLPLPGRELEPCWSRPRYRTLESARAIPALEASERGQ